MKSRSLTTSGVINWVFVLLSATVVWQLRLPSFFARWVRLLGAQVGTPLYHLVVDVLPPILLVGIAWASVQLYDNILWPRMPNSNFQQGWWIYGLIAYGEDDEGPTEVVGHFYVDQTPETVRIPDGKAYIVDEGELVEERGSWSSDTVWIGEDSLKIIFNMRAVDDSGLPESYDGLIDLDLTLDDPLVGIASYRGRFYDLDRGNMILGQIYAERLPRGTASTRRKVEAHLVELGRDFVARSELSIRHPN